MLEQREGRSAEREHRGQGIVIDPAVVSKFEGAASGSFERVEELL